MDCTYFLDLTIFLYKLCSSSLSGSVYSFTRWIFTIQNSSLDFDYLLLFTKTTLDEPQDSSDDEAPKAKKAKKDVKEVDDELVFANYEEEFFHKVSCVFVVIKIKVIMKDFNLPPWCALLIASCDLLPADIFLFGSYF